MTDEKDAVESPPAAGAAYPETADRTFLLECRLDQLHSALQSARGEADLCRTRLAESAAREADHARRALALHEELAAAREEVAVLHRRLEHSEALRAETEGRLLESGARDEAAELSRLRRRVKTERKRAVASERTLTDLRSRIEELTATRETLLTRVAEWQALVRQGDPDAVDLSEFIAALRGDIMELEQKNLAAERREAELREQIEVAGMAATTNPMAHETPAILATSDAEALAMEPAEEPAIEAAPTEEPSEGLAAALAAASTPDSRIELLLRLGRSGTQDGNTDEAFYAIRRW